MQVHQARYSKSMCLQPCGLFYYSYRNPLYTENYEFLSFESYSVKDEMQIWKKRKIFLNTKGWIKQA